VTVSQNFNIINAKLVRKQLLCIHTTLSDSIT